MNVYETYLEVLMHFENKINCLKQRISFKLRKNERTYAYHYVKYYTAYHGKYDFA